MRGNASFQTGRRTYCTVPVVCVPYHMYIPIQYSPPGPLSPLKRMYPYSRPPAGQSYVCRRPANQQVSLPPLLLSRSLDHAQLLS